MRVEKGTDMNDVKRRLARIGKVILVGSGKGGVGKSVVACGLAVSLSSAGFRTALLDLDIHGASVPGYLGVGPPVRSHEGGLVPKERGRLKVMSLALFTGSRPVPMRGGEKQELIAQLFGLTDWGALDFLVVDLPPSMGDELLSAFGLFAGKSQLVLVTTPSPSAVQVVARLRRLAESEGVPVTGVVLNMAYLREGGRVSQPLGKLGERAVKRSLGVEIARIPLDPEVNSKGLRNALGKRSDFSRAFKELAKKV